MASVINRVNVSSDGTSRQQEYDPEMDARVHVSHFGALKTSGTFPVERGNFEGTAIDSNIWTEDRYDNGSTR